jgi:hypothetical protein
MNAVVILRMSRQGSLVIHYAFGLTGTSAGLTPWPA